jgi:hypothetical protein
MDAATAARVGQIRMAAVRDARSDPPLSQDTADLVAAILAGSQPAASAA